MIPINTINYNIHEKISRKIATKDITKVMNTMPEFSASNLAAIPLIKYWKYQSINNKNIIILALHKCKTPVR